MPKNLFHNKEVAEKLEKKFEDMKKYHRKHRHGILKMLFFIAFGAALALLFAPKKGEETRRDLREKAEEYSNRWKKNPQEARKILRKIFGEASENLEKNYVKLRENISDAIEDTRDLTHEKFDEIIYDTVRRFAKGEDWDEKDIYKLTRALQNEWEDFKKASQLKFFDENSQ